MTPKAKTSKLPSLLSIADCAVAHSIRSSGVVLPSATPQSCFSARSERVASGGLAGFGSAQLQHAPACRLAAKIMMESEYAVDLRTGRTYAARDGSRPAPSSRRGGHCDWPWRHVSAEISRHRSDILVCEARHSAVGAEELFDFGQPGRVAAGGCVYTDGADPANGSKSVRVNTPGRSFRSRAVVH